MFQRKTARYCPNNDVDFTTYIRDVYTTSAPDLRSSSSSDHSGGLNPVTRNTIILVVTVVLLSVLGISIRVAVVKCRRSRAPVFTPTPFGEYSGGISGTMPTQRQFISPSSTTRVPVRTISAMTPFTTVHMSHNTHAYNPAYNNDTTAYNPPTYDSYDTASNPPPYESLCNSTSASTTNLSLQNDGSNRCKNLTVTSTDLSALPPSYDAVFENNIGPETRH